MLYAPLGFAILLGTMYLCLAMSSAGLGAAYNAISGNPLKSFVEYRSFGLTQGCTVLAIIVGTIFVIGLFQSKRQKRPDPKEEDT